MNPSPIDWASARTVASSLTLAGPSVGRDEIAATVERLREHAAAAPQHVAAVTKLDEAASGAQAFGRLVVDRQRWARANIDMFAHLLDIDLPFGPTSLGRAATGVEVGVLLALLSSRVLGQFDPFSGRLLLVAPNIVHIRRVLGVEASDFELWVCLHEQTHAVQFAAAPWLADHLQDALTGLVSSMVEDPSDRLGGLLRSLPDLVTGRRGAASPPQAGALMGAVLTEREEKEMARIVATMSLLEGHADVVMDAAGPKVIPTVAPIRRAFNRRRDQPGRFDQVLRRLLGMDAKLEQYRTGARFVRRVVRRVGHEEFNAVFTGPQYLPTPDEMADPLAWVRRVHG